MVEVATAEPAGESDSPRPLRWPAPIAGWLRWLAAVGFAVLTLVVGARLAPHLSMDPMLAYLIGFCAVSAGVLAVAHALPARPPAASAVGLLVPVGALFAQHAAGGAGLGAAATVTACLLLSGSLLGGLIGSRIEHPGHLIFVAIVSSLADVFSVHHPQGISAAIVESEAALSVLALPFAMLGTPNIEPFLGVGDVVFVGLYLSAARVHGLGGRRTLGAVAAGLGLTLGAVATLQVTLPALPLLGLCVVLAHPKARKPPQQDRRRGWLVVGLLSAVLVVAFLMR